MFLAPHSAGFDKPPSVVCAAAVPSRPTRFACLVVALWAFGAPAAAKKPAPRAQRQAEIREVLVGLGLAPEGDTLTIGPRGRRDLVLFSPRAHDAIVALLGEAHTAGRVLANGYYVAGYAHLVQSDTTTFTFKNDAGIAWVVELADAGVGSRLVIWGVGRELVPERRPRAELPMRLLEPEAPTGPAPR